MKTGRKKRENRNETGNITTKFCRFQKDVFEQLNTYM